MNRKDAHVFHELIRSINVRHCSKTDLGDGGANFATSSRDTVGSRVISRREHPPRNDESRHVGSEVLEEV
jgi:hypothetical protein